MVKIVAPKGTTSFSVNGMEIKIGKDGIVDVPENIANELRSHGFERLEGDAKVLAGNRSALITRFIKYARETAEKMTDDQLYKIAELPPEVADKVWGTFGKALEAFKGETAATNSTDWK